MDVTTLIFNVELSGSNIKNLEDITGLKIVDKTNLILDIFASRAKTKQSVLQVELAEYKYRLPRLIDSEITYPELVVELELEVLGKQNLK